MRATCVFVSNYLNHHQIPFCNAMYRLLKEQFLFIQTQAMEEERIRMGWNQNLDYPYLKKYYEQPEECREIIEQAKLVLFGAISKNVWSRKSRWCASVRECTRPVSGKRFLPEACERSIMITPGIEGSRCICCVQEVMWPPTILL